MKNINIYTEKLRESGLRPTRQRLKIWEVLFSPEKRESLVICPIVSPIIQPQPQVVETSSFIAATKPLPDKVSK